MWRLFVWLLPFCGFAQIQFQQSLQPQQLIPRLDAKTGPFTWKLRVTEPSISHVSMIVLADTKRYAFAKQSVQGTLQTLQFPVTLEAKPQEYSFRFYTHQGRDSTLVHQVDRVVCGDFIVLHGQSNMLARDDYDNILATTDDRLLRNFTFHQDIFQVNQLRWYPSKQPYGHTGGVGLNLQKRILQETGIPTCVINAALGGANINQLFDRNPDFPNDLNTQYGRFITRVQEAGANGKIRAFLWRQGENELCGSYVGVERYPNIFSAFFKSIQEDIGFHGYFYNVQLALQSCMFLEEGGILREWIRRTATLFPKTRVITAVGVPIFDGAHHNRAGYEKITGDIYQLMRGDVYGLTVDPQHVSPMIQRIEKHGNRLDLVFQEAQRFRLPNDSTLLGRRWTLKDHFFVDQTTQRSLPNAVDFISVSGNRIQLHLRQTNSAQFVTYLPSYLTTDPPFIGSTLTNLLDKRALAFYQFPISDPLASPAIDSVQYLAGGTYFHSIQKTGFLLEGQRRLKDQWVSIGTTDQTFLIDTLRCTTSATWSYRFRWTAGENTSEWSKLYDIPCHPAEVVVPSTPPTVDENSEPEETKGKRIESRETPNGKRNVWLFEKSIEFQPGFSVPLGSVLETRPFRLATLCFNQ